MGSRFLLLQNMSWSAERNKPSADNIMLETLNSLHGHNSSLMKNAFNFGFDKQKHSVGQLLKAWLPGCRSVKQTPAALKWRGPRNEHSGTNTTECGCAHSEPLSALPSLKPIPTPREGPYEPTSGAALCVRPVLNVHRREGRGEQKVTSITLAELLFHSFH